MDQKPKDLCRTGTSVKKDSFMWIIEDVMGRPEKFNKKVESSVFICGNENNKHSWQLSFYPKGYIYNGYYIREYCGFVIQTNSLFSLPNAAYNRANRAASSSEYAVYEVSILGAANNIIHKSEWVFERTLLPKMITEIPRFLSLEDIVNDEKYLSNGNLTILFEVTITRTVTKNENTQLYFVPETSVHDQLPVFLENKKFSDVTLEIDGRELQSHKLILSSQSPVFFAMFNNDTMKESRDGYVKINDMDYEIAEQLLEFIYTNKEPSMIHQYSNELMAAAHKYQIERLRVMCEKILLRDLSSDNVLKILIYANLYEASNLKKSAIQLIKKNPNIQNSSEFLQFVADNPKLAIEIIQTSVD